MQIAEEGWNPAFGARTPKRAIRQRVENPLAARIRSGDFGDGDSVKVDYEGNTFTFKKARS